MDVLSLVVGLVAGLAVGVLLGAHLASRRKLRDTNAFQAIAAQALQQNNQQFLDLAEQRLANAQQQGAASLQEHRQSFEQKLQPLDQRLKELREATEKLEKDRKQDEGQLKGQLEGLQKATAGLQSQTTALETALRGSSQAGGQWGETALRNVVEFAGMTEHCDFEEQKAADSHSRPDLTVHLPGGRRVAVDAKVPIRDYLTACESEDAGQRKAALGRHVAALRQHVQALSRREYWAALGDGVDLVVLFLPSEAVLAAAFGDAPELLDDALKKKVLLASPTTLVALLRTMALYWQQRSVADNAREIADTAKELYKRVTTFVEHLGKVGKGLQSATKGYNSAVRSLESRVVPTGRRLEEMKVPDGADTLEAPALVEEEPREV